MLKLFLLFFIFLNTLAFSANLTLKAHGGVVQFDGNSSSYISIADDAIFAYSSALTVEAWVNIKEIESNKTIVRQYDFEQDDRSFTLSLIGDKTQFIVSSDGTINNASTLTSTTSLSVATWHHIAGVFDGSNVIIYIDGVEDTRIETGFTTVHDGNDSIYIGAAITSGGVQEQMAGQIDEVRIWEGARTQLDLNATKNQQLVGDEKGLLAYYNFDERIGSTVKDITSNGNDGVIEGNVTRQNFLGDGLSFDGSGDLVDFGHSADYNFDTNDSFTISLWMKASSTISAPLVILRKQEGNLVNYPYYFRHEESGSLAVARHDGTNTPTIISTRKINDNAYHYITFLKDESTLKLYIDGVLEASTTDTTTASTSNSDPLKIGENDFNGTLSEVSIWNTALSISNIQQNMYVSLKGDEAGLVGYWPLNEGTGSIVYDKSTNENNGTITGATWIDTAPTLYGNTIYTTNGYVTSQQLVVENGLSSYDYEYNGTKPDTVIVSVSDLNASGNFLYEANGVETLTFKATDVETREVLTSSISIVTYPGFIDTILKFEDINRTEHNLSKLVIEGQDGISKYLYADMLNVGESVTYSLLNLEEGNYTVSLFTDENTTRWYYKTTDLKFYLTDDGTNDFHLNITEKNLPPVISLVLANWDDSILNLDLSNVNTAEINISSIYLQNSNGINTLVTTSLINGDNNFSALVINDNNYSIKFTLSSGEDFYYNFDDNKLYEIVDNNPSFVKTISLSSETVAIDSSTSNFIGDTIDPTITQIYDRFLDVNASALHITFSINDTSQSDLILSLVRSTTLVDSNLTSDNTVTTQTLTYNDYNDKNLTLTVTPLADKIGISNFELQVKDASNNQISEHFRVVLDYSDQYHTIETKKTLAEYDALSSQNVSGNVYTLETYTDFSADTPQRVVNYQRHAISSNTVVGEYQVRDVSGIVSYETKDINIPDTLKFDTILDYNATSNLFNLNGINFTFLDANSSSQEVYIKYLSDTLIIDEIYFNDGTTYNTLSEFIADVQKNEISYGLLRTYDESRFITLGSGTTEGEIIEFNADGTATTENVGSWSVVTFGSQEVLLFNITKYVANDDGGYTIPNTDYKLYSAFILDETDKKIKKARYYAKDDVFSSLVLNKTAKDELYKSISSNPKITKQLNNGYTYVSISKTLCDATRQADSFNTFCDQSNTIESVFGSTNIELVLKYGEQWIFWKNGLTADEAASYTIPNFGTINKLEGLLIRTNAAVNIDIPFNEDDEDSNDFVNLAPEKWVLMSNKKEQTVAQISASITARGKTLKYLLLLRDAEWYIYAPTNDSDISATIKRLSTVNRYEVFWVYFID
ncbi:LamG domain-containing protein [Sulfurimonas sp. SAG-AH-194-I05]|nr:LamG domain-containing protein [Sulfurimonas sp. SAG-AH-194-I05]MDF1874968.1 LamG domain-containing protein [Sulfurimonas sp. SAG-AH-194-I05]